jgi:hypothetical protein
VPWSRRQRRGEWRYAITDTAGRLVVDGITRRRPTGLTTFGPRGGTVELHIPAALLTALNGGERVGEAAPASWAGVVGDIARQYADRGRRDLDARPDRRLPGAALRRHTQIRDRTCIGVGCRRPARHCDQDHTTDYQHGGPTVAAGLGPLCRHDHILKHRAGWALEQPTTGRFTWTSQLRGRYEVRPEPVLPAAPGIRPGPDDPEHDLPAPPGPDRLILWKPDPPPPADPDPIDLDGPLPF